MKKYIIPIVLLMLVTTLSFVMAGDFKINYGGAQIFTVATNGTTTIQNEVVAGWLSAVGNISTSAYFVGNGRYLTNLVIPDNSTKVDYHNVTGIPTCGANTYLKFDGTTLTCVAVTNALISGENITSGTINETRLSSTIYTIGLNASKLAVGTIPFARLPALDNMTTLHYTNITGIPACTVTQFLQLNATGMFCVAPTSSGFDSTNLAFINKSQTFAEEQNFSKFLNVTEGIRLMNNNSVITRDGVATNISIDSGGNVIINLG
jgi:hypothetical protein